MITERELRGTLLRQAESYEVPPYDLLGLRLAAERRRRGTRLRYGGMVAAALLAVGVAWGQSRADRADVQPTGSPSPSDVTISPSCFPFGEPPPVPDGPWAGGGFLSDEPVPATRPAGRSCTLVLRYGFHRFGPGPFVSGMVWLYSDGRLIIDTATEQDWFTQWERRLTPSGVEHMRSAVASMLGKPAGTPRRDSEASIHFGSGTFYPKDTGALKRLFIDLSWVPGEEWVMESPSIYRAAWYLTCYEMRGSEGVDVQAAVRDLPSGARAVLESRVWTARPRLAVKGVWPECVVLSRADAAVLAEALGGDIAEGMAIVFAQDMGGTARQFSLYALMPDGTSGAHGD
jgi:hypothetical protein